LDVGEFFHAAIYPRWAKVQICSAEIRFFISGCGWTPAGLSSLLD
jgi:hypothetical protein